MENDTMLGLANLAKWVMVVEEYGGRPLLDLCINAGCKNEKALLIVLLKVLRFSVSAIFVSL